MVHRKEFRNMNKVVVAGFAALAVLAGVAQADARQRVVLDGFTFSSGHGDQAQRDWDRHVAKTYGPNYHGFVPATVFHGDVRGGFHCSSDNGLPSCDNLGDRYGGGG
jgi:hypothetical protein